MCGMCLRERNLKPPRTSNNSVAPKNPGIYAGKFYRRLKRRQTDPSSSGFAIKGFIESGLRSFTGIESRRYRKAGVNQCFSSP